DQKNLVHVWDLSGPEPKPRCRVPGGLLYGGFALAPAGDLLALVGPSDWSKEATGTVSLWEIGGAEPKRREQVEVKHNPLGVASGDGGKAREVWQRLVQRRTRWRVEGGLKQTEELAFPPDLADAASNGTRTVVLTGSGGLRLHDDRDLHVLLDATPGRAEFF